MKALLLVCWKNNGGSNKNERDRTPRFMWKTQIKKNHKHRTYKFIMHKDGYKKKIMEEEEEMLQ